MSALISFKEWYYFPCVGASHIKNVHKILKGCLEKFKVKAFSKAPVRSSAVSPPPVAFNLPIKVSI